MTKMIQTVVFAAVMLLSAVAFSYEYRQDDLIISNPWVYETAQNQREAPVYMSIKNLSRYDDILLSASTRIADRVELHGMQYEDGVGYMRPLRQGMYIDAGRNTVLRADRDHLMLVNLRRPLNRGDEFYLKLFFKYSGSVSVKVTVEAPRFYDKYYHYFYYFFDFDYRNRDRDRDWDRDHRDDDHRGRRDHDRDDHRFQDRGKQDHRDQGRPDRNQQAPRIDQGDQARPGPGQIEQPRKDQQVPEQESPRQNQSDQARPDRNQQAPRIDQGDQARPGAGQFEQPRREHQDQGQQGRGQGGKGQEQLPFDDLGKNKSKHD